MPLMPIIAMDPLVAEHRDSLLKHAVNARNNPERMLIHQLDLALHQVRPVGPDADLDGHRCASSLGFEIRHTLPQPNC